jgi:hypothetical protein
MTCPGALIVHGDGTIAGCVLDDEPEGCRGRELRHEGDPVRCWVWTADGCNYYCGIQCL